MRKIISAVLMALALFASTMTMCSAPIVQANYWNADGYLLENDPLIILEALPYIVAHSAFWNSGEMAPILIYDENLEAIQDFWGDFGVLDEQEIIYVHTFAVNDATDIPTTALPTGYSADLRHDLEDLRHLQSINQSITVLVCGTDEGTIAERDWMRSLGSLQASLHNLYVADSSERWQYVPNMADCWAILNEFDGSPEDPYFESVGYVGSDVGAMSEEYWLEWKAYQTTGVSYLDVLVTADAQSAATQIEQWIQDQGIRNGDSYTVTFVGHLADNSGSTVVGGKDAPLWYAAPIQAVNRKASIYPLESTPPTPYQDCPVGEYLYGCVEDLIDEIHDWTKTSEILTYTSWTDSLQVWGHQTYLPSVLKRNGNSFWLSGGPLSYAFASNNLSAQIGTVECRSVDNVKGNCSGSLTDYAVYFLGTQETALSVMLGQRSIFAQYFKYNTTAVNVNSVTPIAQDLPISGGQMVSKYGADSVDVYRWWIDANNLEPCLALTVTLQSKHGTYWVLNGHGDWRGPIVGRNGCDRDGYVNWEELQFLDLAAPAVFEISHCYAGLYLQYPTNGVLTDTSTVQALIQQGSVLALIWPSWINSGRANPFTSSSTPIGQLNRNSTYIGIIMGAVIGDGDVSLDDLGAWCSAHDCD